MNYTTPGNSAHSKLCCLIVCSPAEVFHGLPKQYCWGHHRCSKPTPQYFGACGPLFYTTIFFCPG